MPGSEPVGWPGSRGALHFAVFVTGAAVLVLEIGATRLLSPYYGSTLYTVSSVITVVLGALSLGYTVGGRLADRRPDPSWFYGTIAGAGVATLALRVLATTLLPAFGFELPLDTGPLVMTPILFFLPCFLLALLSPWAIKLQSLRHPEIGSGQNAGAVFFWSTLGSIAGSLSSGFYLVPTLGLSRLFLATGLVLVLLGSSGLIASRRKRAVAALVAFVAGLCGLPSLLEPKTSALYRRDGVYQKIQVFDTTFDDRPVRELWLDRSASGVMYRDSDELAYPYTRYHRLTDVFCARLSRALVLGAGPYSVPKDLLARNPDLVVDVVDIEPELLAVAQRFFALKDDARLVNHVADARGFLTRTPDRYDLIFMDVFHSITLPVHVTTREYFDLARERLTPDGIVVSNVVSDLGAEPPSLLGSLALTFETAFPGALFLAVESTATRDEQNFIFVGSRRRLQLEPGDARLAGHPLAEIRSLLEHRLGPRELRLDGQWLLTDESAQTDLLTARQVRRRAREG